MKYKKKNKGQPPLHHTFLPAELNVKRHHRKADTRGHNPLTRDHDTVHGTDGLFISNCEPIAGMTSGQVKRLGNVKPSPQKNKDNKNKQTKKICLT